MNETIALLVGAILGMIIGTLVEHHVAKKPNHYGGDFGERGGIYSKCMQCGLTLGGDDPQPITGCQELDATESKDLKKEFFDRFGELKEEWGDYIPWQLKYVKHKKDDKTSLDYPMKTCRLDEREIMSDAIEFSKMGWVDQGRIEERERLIKEIEWMKEYRFKDEHRDGFNEALKAVISHIRDTK